MIWDRSETIALAKPFCAICNGEGHKAIRKGIPTPCNCVLRGVFRACYARFRTCAAKEKFLSQLTLVPCKGKESQKTFSRLNEEYCADFCLVGRRHLDDFDHSVFRNHFVLGADWRLCCQYMKIDRGDFFHSVYRIQQILGRVFRELEPYGLFPVDEYFGGRINKPKLLVMPSPRKQKAVRPPLRKIA
jgi:hypothetical protein